MKSWSRDSACLSRSDQNACRSWRHCINRDDRLRVGRPVRRGYPAMTPDQFLALQEQLFAIFGPLIPWLITAFAATGILTGLTIFALVFLRGI